MALQNQKTWRRWTGLLTGRLGRGLHDAMGELFPSQVESEVQQAEEEGWTVNSPVMYCWRCGATAASEAVTARGCPFCVNHQKVPWDGVVRLSAYEQPLSGWVLAMKFAAAWAWAPWFGRQLAEAVNGITASPETDRRRIVAVWAKDAAPVPSASSTPTDASTPSPIHPGTSPAMRAVVCPVPMFWTRRLWRGFNQSTLMARAFSDTLGWPMAPLLRRTRRTTPQSILPASSRITNVRQSFAMPHPVDLTGWDVWLIDDVKTTGSTLTACARLLRRAGAKRIFVAVSAVGDPRGSDFTTI